MVARRFRLGGKKEAAGVAVAVIQTGIMDIEYDLDFRRVILWAGFSSLTMDNGEPTAARFAMWRFQDAIERSHGAILSAVRTLPQRRAGSKPSERVGDGDHEESKPAK